MENELISNAPLDVSFWGLVLQADAVVKIVMLILLIASIWSWSIIIEKTKRFLSLKRKAQIFEDAFWSGESLEELYKEEQVLDYVQDLVFIPYYEKGKPMTSIGSYIPSDDKAFDLRTVDIGLVIRSTNPFFRQDKAGTMARKIISIATTNSSSARNIQQADKYLRDTITVTANARNVGLNQ